MSDDSPAELYDAQPRGSSPQCSGGTNCFLSADNIAWAQRAGSVVAVAVVRRDTPEGPPTFTIVPNLEIDLLNRVTPKL